MFQEALQRPGTSATSGAAEALDKELAGCRFCDPRLGRRFRRLVGQLATSLGQTIPLGCQDWTNTKAAYRFLSNGRVNETAILDGHFQATRERFAATEGPILILHDTTEFSYTRESKQAIGILYKTCGRKDKDGRPRLHTVCGILMHSSLAVTAEGLPLELAAIKFWTRSKFKGTNALKRKVNPTRVLIEAKESVRWLENLKQSTSLLDEPSRCIHIGDRESDIYELFCAAQESGTKFLVRTCVDRLAGDGRHTIAAAMRRVKVKATHEVEVRDAKGGVNPWAAPSATDRRALRGPRARNRSGYVAAVRRRTHAGLAHVAARAGRMQLARSVRRLAVAAAGIGRCAQCGVHAVGPGGIAGELVHYHVLGAQGGQAF